MKRKREIELIPRNKTMQIPIRATYTYDRKTGELIDKEFEYADVSIVEFTEFLMRNFGIDAKPREIAIDPDTQFAVGAYTKNQSGEDSIVFLKPRFAHESLAFAFMKGIAPTYDKDPNRRLSIFKIDPVLGCPEDILEG